MDHADLKQLHSLRTLFLNAKGSLKDYWENEQLVALYDSFYARRIAWKWGSVLKELSSKGFAPSNHWIDWGCGSGVATEAMLEQYKPEKVYLFDRSHQAVRYASNKLKKIAPEVQFIPCTRESEFPYEGSTVLLSHVLTELPDPTVQKLSQNLKSAHCLLWVEPGTPFCAEKLRLIRENLRETSTIVAPCPHQSDCGLARRPKDWCHNFAKPPPSIFQDGEWVKTAKELGIDLRSLPTSFLAFQKDYPISSVGKKRIIGTPRHLKGHSKAILCQEAGVTDETFPHKLDKEFIKNLEKIDFNLEI